MGLRKVVLDTNVWLSALFWNGEARKIIFLAENKKVKIIVSQEIMEEIVNVLNREAKFQRFLKEKDENIEDLIRTILHISELVSTKTKLRIVKEDPSDNMILEAALDGKADYVLTYDNHLLKLEEFGKVKILSPKDFLEIV